MLLNINATRGPTDCCSATHGLLLSEATGLWDAESIIFNRGRSVASWTFTGRVFGMVWYGMVWYIYFSETVQSNT